MTPDASWQWGIFIKKPSGIVLDNITIIVVRGNKCLKGKYEGEKCVQSYRICSSLKAMGIHLQRENFNIFPLPGLLVY
jgi:hypothetical protein